MVFKLGNSMTRVERNAFTISYSLRGKIGKKEVPKIKEIQKPETACLVFLEPQNNSKQTAGQYPKP